MGKEQRRKGNAQCASSSKAAEMLQNCGISFVGLNSTISEGEIGISANIPMEIHTAFKKLNKQDPITREKAVKEILGIIGNTPVEELKDVFICYSSIYAKLVTDNVPAIRLSANSLLLSLLQKLRKNANFLGLKTTLPYLLISLNDANGAVKRSAEQLFDNCFEGDKRQLVIENFGKNSLEICMEIINKKHKLVQPQKFAEDESDSQRQSRLIAQALITMEKLLLDVGNSDIRLIVCENFQKVATINFLMSLQNNVKVALFSLLKSLMVENSEMLLTTRVPTIVLNNLDSMDGALCKQAFDCFFAMTHDSKFFEKSCKIDKAVVPKFLALIRRKTIHWNVLEFTLAPSFKIIYKNLPMNDRLKWIKSSLDSFFDGSIDTISIRSWGLPFLEIIEYSLTIYEELDEKNSLLKFVLTKVIDFLNIILEKSPNNFYLLKKLADLIRSIWQIEVEESKTNLNEFKNTIRLNVINKLPLSSNFAQILVEELGDLKFGLDLVDSTQTSDPLFVKAIEEFYGEIAVKWPNLESLLVKRILAKLSIPKSEEEMNKIKILTILCRFLLENRISNGSITALIESKDIRICLYFLKMNKEIFKKVLNNEQKFQLSKTIIEEILHDKNRANGEEQDLFIDWILDEFDNEGDMVVQWIFQTIMQVEQDYFTLKFLHKFSTAKKIPKNYEEKIFTVLFETLLNSEYANWLEHEQILDILNGLNLCTLENYDYILEKFFNKSEVDCIRVKNASSSMKNLKIIGNSNKKLEDVKTLANKLDSMFSIQMLIDENVHLFAYLSSFKTLNMEILMENNFDYILQLAKRALYSQILLLENSISYDFNDGKDYDSIFVWLAIIFIEAFRNFTSILEQQQILDEFLIELKSAKVINDNQLIVGVNVFFDDFLFPPISIIFALIKTFESQNSDGFLNKIPTLQTNQTIANFYSSVLTFNLKGEQPIPLALNVDNGEDMQALICQYIYEFEHAFAAITDENRAQHFVTLSLFIERKSEQIDEWLFTFQGDNILKDTLSCVILRFFCKVVPFLAEIGGPILDFINVGFVTALQSCSEHFLNSQIEKQKNPLFYVFAINCLRIYTTYNNCIKLNGNSVEYFDIKQEWNEFFGTSSTNFILSWLLNNSNFVKKCPQIFIQNLCRTIHFMDSEKILNSKLQILKDEKTISEFFVGYPPSNDLRNLLTQTAILFNNSIPEIQLASFKIFQSTVLSMFKIENSTQNPTTTSTMEYPYKDKEIGEEEMDDDDEKMDDEIGTTKKLPRFFENYLRENFSAPPNERSIDPLLLCWDVLMGFMAELDVLSRVVYCDSLNLKHVSTAMNRLFSCLPENPNDEKMFSQTINYQHLKVFNLNNYLCNLYYRSLITVPALIRQWYNSLNKNGAKIVNRYTNKNVSHLVLKREIKNVANIKRGRLEVKVMSNVNEVQALYKLEDTTIRLSIALPEDYPLQLALIETDRAIGGKDLHRKWLLQLEKFLSHQNGSILDGLLLWKKNIDKHLEGVEDCTICMMTVSITNYQLPKIRCRQCKKKFHGDCLYKWFQTSNNSSCPLCRSHFS